MILSGEVRCWGDNRAGQLGNGTIGGYEQNPQVVTGFSGNVIDIAVGNIHVCALIDNGSVQCWGDNKNGKLGVGLSNQFVTSPTTVLGLSNIASISAGFGHTCAITISADMFCWGENTYGQIGDGTTNMATSPVSVLIPNGVTEISAGTQNTCAISSNRAFCWGWNDYGQTGNGVPSVSVTNPTLVSGIPQVKSISTGNGHSCAVDINGKLFCWGQNQYGQLGNGNTNQSSTPAATGIVNALQVSVSDAHTCAVLTSGEVKCFGWNKYGQLGNGLTPSSINSTPSTVVNINNAVQVSAKFSHTCVVSGAPTQQGGNVDISCFGSGYNGALGNNLTNNSNIPVFAIQNYSCCIWEDVSDINEPTPRRFFSKIWAGAPVNKMIIWGGQDIPLLQNSWSNAALSDGGMFDPYTNTWTSMSQPISAIISPRQLHSAVWTGNEMIIWGGGTGGMLSSNQGYIYNIATDTWSLLCVQNQPSISQRSWVGFDVWTGDKLIIWGSVFLQSNNLYFWDTGMLTP